MADPTGSALTGFVSLGSWALLPAYAGHQLVDGLPHGEAFLQEFACMSAGGRLAFMSLPYHHPRASADARDTAARIEGSVVLCHEAMSRSQLGQTSRRGARDGVWGCTSLRG